jgi:hypothetical protein
MSRDGSYVVAGALFVLLLLMLALSILLLRVTRPSRLDRVNGTDDPEGVIRRALANQVWKCRAAAWMLMVFAVAAAIELLIIVYAARW